MPGITTQNQADQAIDQAGRKNPSLHRILTYLLAQAGTTALEARIAANETAVATARAIALANSSSITVNETAIALNTAKQTGLILGWAYVHQSTALVAFKPPIADTSGSAGDGGDVEQFVADAVTYDGLAVDAGDIHRCGVSFRGHHIGEPVGKCECCIPDRCGWDRPCRGCDLRLTVGQHLSLRRLFSERCVEDLGLAGFRPFPASACLP